jgi:hypothetical protein
MAKALLATVFVLAAASTALGTPQRAEPQTEHTLKVPQGAPPAPASLAEFSWLVGSWTGTGLGGVSEEVWSPPAGGAMMGMYRLIVNGKVSFYEFMNLVEENGSVALKLKHFDPDLTGWEEKDRFVSFPLVRMSPSAVYFGGLTFRRLGPDRLQIFLAIRSADGTIREEEFLMQRRPEPSK